MHQEKCKYCNVLISEHVIYAKKTNSKYGGVKCQY